MHFVILVSVLKYKLILGIIIFFYMYNIIEKSIFSQCTYMLHTGVSHMGHMFIVLVASKSCGGRIASTGRFAILRAIPIGLREVVPCG